MAFKECSGHAFFSAAVLELDSGCARDPVSGTVGLGQVWHQRTAGKRNNTVTSRAFRTRLLRHEHGVNVGNHLGR